MPLRLKYGTWFDHRAYRNVSKRRAPVGGSQVTALVEPVAEPSEEADYEINLRAFLSESYWIRLTDALELSSKKLAALNRFSDVPIDKWTAFVSCLRDDDASSEEQHDPQLRLF